MYLFLEQKNKESLNQSRPTGNFVDFSLFNQLEHKVGFRAFSIKYVLDGLETYSVNGKNFPVKTNHYLLANPNAEGKVFIDSTKDVKGMCIDIFPEFLDEVMAHHIRPDAPDADLHKNYFNSTSFLENVYADKETQLGKFLSKTAYEINLDPKKERFYTNTFFYALTECLIFDQIPIINQLYKIPTVKHNTRKDLYRRLIEGKNFLYEHFTHNIEIKQAAQAAALSEYHFFRLFRAAFSISPQQYLIQLRIDFAYQLLEKENYSISEIAKKSGFADISHFSRTYKKLKGFSPSQQRYKF